MTLKTTQHKSDPVSTRALQMFVNTWHGPVPLSAFLQLGLWREMEPTGHKQRQSQQATGSRGHWSGQVQNRWSGDLRALELEPKGLC